MVGGDSHRAGECLALFRETDKECSALFSSWGKMWGGVVVRGASYAACGPGNTTLPDLGTVDGHVCVDFHVPCSCHLLHFKKMIICGAANLWLTSSISYRLLSQALLPPTVTQNDVFVYASSHRFFSVWHRASHSSLCVMVRKWDVKDWQIKWCCRVKVYFSFSWALYWEHVSVAGDRYQTVCLH